MKDFQYTDYGINHANKDAIVYRFANGEVREITAADFGGDENEFRKWKELSDNDLHDEENHMRSISRKDVSINGLDETDLSRLPSMEEVFEGQNDDGNLSTEVNAYLMLLTETEKRRLLLLAVYQSVVKVAEIENVTHPAVCKTLTNVQKKLKKYEKMGYENGKKMAVSERINSLRVLVGDHWRRINTENE